MWSPKDPNDTADFVMDWSDLLAGDTIATLDDVVIAPATSPALTEAGSPFIRSTTGTTTTIWLTGGEAGETYTVNETITTVGGRVYQRAVQLCVQDTVPVPRWPVVVTLAQAKHHLRITGSDDDPDLQLKLDMAHALVLDYVNQRRSGDVAWAAEVAAWTTVTVPPQVQAAVFVQMGELWRFRGDDPVTNQTGLLSPMVRAYVDRLRDPAVS